MAKRKGSSTAITYKGFVHLPNVLLDHSDFISLRGSALKMLIDLASQYRGSNNGDLCAAMSILKRRGWNSNSQISRAVRELIEKNLIVQTKQGGLNIGPNLYAITWQPINDCGGKLDVSSTITAPRKL